MQPGWCPPSNLPGTLLERQPVEPCTRGSPALAARAAPLPFSSPRSLDLIPSAPGVTLIPGSGVLPLADALPFPASPLLLAAPRAADSGDGAVPGCTQCPEQPAAAGRAGCVAPEGSAGRAGPGSCPLVAALPFRGAAACCRHVPPGNCCCSPAFGGCRLAPPHHLFVRISRWEASGLGFFFWIATHLMHS